jgi:hypothetical protein
VVKKPIVMSMYLDNFQIMVANGGMMKCGGKCKNVKLQMGIIKPNPTCLLLKWETVKWCLGEEWLI